MATHKKISFSPMTSILKKPSARENNCREWIATEKVHGASFQFYTSDGDTIHLGSRTRCLDGQVSFQKCNLVEFLARHSDHVKNIYQEVKMKDHWQQYRAYSERVSGDTDSDDEDYEAMATRRQKDLEVIERGEKDAGREADVDSYTQPSIELENKQGLNDTLEVRIYGELYGGGGVDKDIKPAVQKEIIYCDEFRFYVFGITINKKWVNVVEMNNLCKNAGFPYFAVPVCEPRSTLEELQDFLISSGFMNSRSRLTERSDDFKTKIEGVVMSPLVRPDNMRHAIKLLSAAFTDVRHTGKGKNVQINYCTKARYLSVISKLDIPEREDTEMITTMFIEDIEKESGEPLSINKRKGCVKAVRGWLLKDGYIKDSQNYQAKKHAESSARPLYTEEAINTSDPVDANTDIKELDIPFDFDSLFGDF